MATATTTSPRAAAPAKPTLLGGVRGLDAAVSLRLHALFLPVPRLLLKALEVAGDGRIWLPVPISLLLLSASPANASGAASPLLVGLVAGLVLDLVLVGLVKVVVRRPRPAYNAKDMYVAVAADHWSFPSGHSSRAFLVASFLAASGSGGGGGFLPREALFLWATATSASRVLLGRHYVLDVVAGACLGVFEAWLSNSLLRFMCALNTSFLVAYTFDAGPNVVLIAQNHKTAAQLLQKLLYYFPPQDKDLSSCLVGDKSILGDGGLHSMEDVEALPAPPEMKIPDQKFKGDVSYFICSRLGSGPKVVADNIQALIDSVTGPPKGV